MSETKSNIITILFAAVGGLVAWAIIMLIAGCMAGPVGPAPSPATPPLLEGTFHVEGKWDFIVRVVGIVVPLPGLPVSGTGRATITVQSRPPWATVDADLDTVIDPTPAATQARSNGQLLIRRAGKPAGFAPEGAPVGPPPPPQAQPAPSETPK